MAQQIPEVIDFRKRLHEWLQHESHDITIVKIAKHKNVYNQGDKDGMIYFIDSGQIKLIINSPAGKECLTAIHTAGDVFGESCLAGLGRLETATVMESARLRRIPSSRFLMHLKDTLLHESFARYLVARIAEQQQIIANLMTAEIEYRLGDTLLMLALKLGKPDSRGIRIEHKITHEELSAMVGTTRPRISEFLKKFRSLGLVEISKERFLVVHKNMLADYLAQVM